MDHTLEKLQVYLCIQVEELREERATGKYPRIYDLPSYPATKALVDAMNCLEIYIYGKKRTKIKDLI
jgi:hypothetical protein